jgi:hypothetical protein
LDWLFQPDASGWQIVSNQTDKPWEVAWSHGEPQFDAKVWRIEQTREILVMVPCLSEAVCDNPSICEAFVVDGRVDRQARTSASTGVYDSSFAIVRSLLMAAK